jgi:uncharacterized protein YciI
MAETFFVIVHRRGPAWEAQTPYVEQPLIGEHIGFMRSLDERGVLVLGGPFVDDETTEIVGMAIVRADDQRVAEELAAEDPSIAIGLIRADVRPWRAVMGSALGR